MPPRGAGPRPRERPGPQLWALGAAAASPSCLSPSSLLLPPPPRHRQQGAGDPEFILGPLAVRQGPQKGARCPHPRRRTALTPVTRRAQARALSAGSWSRARRMRRVGGAKGTLVRGAPQRAGRGGGTRVAGAASAVLRGSAPGPACPSVLLQLGERQPPSRGLSESVHSGSGAAFPSGSTGAPWSLAGSFQGRDWAGEGGVIFPGSRGGGLATPVPARLGSKESGCRDARVPERGQQAFPGPRRQQTG